MPSHANNFRTALVMFTGALVIAACLAGGWIWRGLEKTANSRTGTRSILIGWQKVYSSLKDVETGARGYVITEDTAYLQPFDKATSQLPQLMLIIAQGEQQIENGLTQDALADFQKKAQDFLNETREIISITKREGQEKAAALLKDGAAKRSMDQVREFCDSHLADLDKRLRSYDAKMMSDLKTGGRGIAALAIAAIIAGFAAWYMLQDVLLHSRQNERLEVEKEQADQANREKSTFLATMSHEIRTPMNAILGFGELLLSDARDEKQQRYAGSIVRSGQALLQLINDILDLSKIEAGMVEISTAPLNVTEIADFTRQLFVQQSAAKGIDLNVTVDPAVPPSLLLDGARLRQIVLNLVGNALKFTSQGQVSVHFYGQRSAAAGRFHLYLDVEDTGLGIPQDRLDDIFEPFVQAKGHRDTELKGTGLGLAIVKRLALLMGGSVSVKSVEGQGSVFSLQLPEVEISARLAQSLSPEERPVDFNELKPFSLLAVDDNPVNLSLIHGYFDGTSHRIHTATNGQEALDWLANHPRPDLVLMDIRMPVMDGKMALSEIRKRKEYELLPVIALTASSLSGEESALRQAFDGYIRKPCTRAQLFQELAQFITHQPATPTIQPAIERADWTHLGSELAELESKVWPSVKDEMVMSEVRLFAESLMQKGHDHRCSVLTDYAGKLLEQVENFSTNELEHTLNRFPELLKEIGSHTTES